MNLNGIKNRKEYISKVLFAVSVVLAVLTAGKVLSFAVSSIRTGGRIEAAVAKNGQNDEAVKACIAANRAVADKIKERNMFAEPKAKPNPPTCIAILGSKALINDKWYGVGDEVVGAKIVAIGPKDVTILWEEKEKKLIPFEATVKEGSQRPPSAPPEKSEGAEERRPSPAPSAEERRGERPFGRRGMGRFFENMSEDERRQMRERMRNMSREERRQFFEERRGEIESEQN
jgi:hypothetical protein